VVRRKHDGIGRRAHVLFVARALLVFTAHLDLRFFEVPKKPG
jgi:hypothetical protein